MHAIESYSFLTSKGVLKLNLIEDVEPNNGRMLYKVSLFLDNKNVTTSYFGDWDHINYYLDHYQLISADKRWIYIPKENNHFLIDSETLEKIDLLPVHLSAAVFIGNIFYEHSLFVVIHNEIISKNLQTGKSKRLKRLEKGIYYYEIVSNDSKNIVIRRSDGIFDRIIMESLHV